MQKILTPNRQYGEKMEKEEEIASERRPLDEKIHTELIELGKQAGCNWLEATVAG